MKAGKYQLITYEQNPAKVRKITPEHEQRLITALNKLPELVLSDFFLCGGVSLYLNLGKFCRAHDDFDISVKDTEVGDFVASLSESDYGLFSRLAVVNLKPNVRGCLYERLDDGKIKIPENKMLRAIRLDESGKIKQPLSLLDCIDVYLISTRNGNFVSNKGHQLPPNNFDGNRYSTESGKSIKTVSLESVVRLKRETPDTEKSRFDLRMVNNYLN